MNRWISAIYTLLLPIAVISTGTIPAEEKNAESMSVPITGQIQAKNFSGLLGLAGFSDTMLKNHFQLYQGAVKNTNDFLERLKVLLADKKDNTPEYAELKRRLGWEFNSVWLHEYYFENMGGQEPLPVNSALHKKILENFGSFYNWKKDFISTGLMRGIGWVVLYWEPRSGKLINAWIDGHNTGHLAAAKPLLVLDVFEHAYITDYQIDKAKYIETFFKNINWKAVTDRFGDK